MYYSINAKRHGILCTGSRRLSSTLFLSNILPDASASAAGFRTQFLLQKFEKNCLSKGQVHFATGSSAGASSTLQNSMMHWLPPNRSDLRDELWSKLSVSNKGGNLEYIVFDRFYTEEAYSFGFRANNNGKDDDPAMVLDMQDMHSLRWARQALVQDYDTQYANSSQTLDPLEIVPEAMAHFPGVTNDRLLRELASIHRSDLTLVCSPVELEHLLSTYQIPQHKLVLAPFFVDPTHANVIGTLQQPPPQQPSHARFVSCGGFQHAPNLDATNLLLRSIWPRIRKSLPEATLHIHGAYCPASIVQQANPAMGVVVHGFTKELEDIFVPGSVVLAPLRFGAGIKGKIVDAWTFGLPVVTTGIGSEGMLHDNNDGRMLFGGIVANTLESFCQAAVQLAVDEATYQTATGRGQALLRQLYDAERNWGIVETALLETKRNIRQLREQDYVRAILLHQSHRSTEYFSRWLELKETNARKEQAVKRANQNNDCNETNENDKDEVDVQS